MSDSESTVSNKEPEIHQVDYKAIDEKTGFKVVDWDIYKQYIKHVLYKRKSERMSKEEFVEKFVNHEFTEKDSSGAPDKVKQPGDNIVFNYDPNYVNYAITAGIYAGERDFYNLKSGRSKMLYANGDFYEGEFVDDMRHGEGHYRYHSCTYGELDVKIMQWLVQILYAEYQAIIDAQTNVAVLLKQYNSSRGLYKIARKLVAVVRHNQGNDNGGFFSQIPATLIQSLHVGPTSSGAPDPTCMVQPTALGLSKPQSEPTTLGLSKPQSEPTAPLGLSKPQSEPTAPLGLSKPQSEPTTLGLSKPQSEPTAPLGLSKPQSEPTAPLGLSKPQSEPTTLGLSKPQSEPTAPLGLSKPQSEPTALGLSKPQSEPTAPLGFVARLHTELAAPLGLSAVVVEAVLTEGFGAHYRGRYVAGAREGTGVFRAPDGSVYRGQYHNNKRHGQGVYHYLNGDTYSGEWHNNKRHGFGVYQFAGSTWGAIKGQWEGHYCVKGQWCMPDGRYYEGRFASNPKQGLNIPLDKHAAFYFPAYNAKITGQLKGVAPVIQEEDAPTHSKQFKIKNFSPDPFKIFENYKKRNTCWIPQVGIQRITEST